MSHHLGSCPGKQVPQLLPFPTRHCALPLPPWERPVGLRFDVLYTFVSHLATFMVCPWRSCCLLYLSVPSVIQIGTVIVLIR